MTPTRRWGARGDTLSKSEGGSPRHLQGARHPVHAWPTCPHTFTPPPLPPPARASKPGAAQEQSGGTPPPTHRR
eukprot:2355296-Prymnesium_polylepis.1